MSGERHHDPNSSAENLLQTSSEGSIDSNGMNGYINPVGPESIPSSPPPSYQHVLEETRLAALNENKLPSKSNRSPMVKQISIDSINLESNRSSPIHTSKTTRRSNTISSDESIHTTVNQRMENKENFEQEKDNIEYIDNAPSSENWQDYQEPSTSYDVSSRQFDESSIATLAMDQYEKDSDEEAGVYETINESEIEEEIEEQKHEQDSKEVQEYECKLRHQQHPENYIEVPNKTSKEMYLAMAKEMGLVCRMSDQCRCLDCQGGYLECGEGEGGDENIKTDGGLGAGTPMFVSEAFGHGMAPACVILLLVCWASVEPDSPRASQCIEPPLVVVRT